MPSRVKPGCGVGLSAAPTVPPSHRNSAAIIRQLRSDRVTAVLDIPGREKFQQKLAMWLGCPAHGQALGISSACGTQKISVCTYGGRSGLPSQAQNGARHGAK